MKTLANAILVLPLLVAAPATETAAGAFPDVTRIESELVRGVSTKDDARAVLGLPDGVGEAVLPPDHRPRRVWYYEDIEISDLASAPGGGFAFDMRQQLLLVYFDGDLYDGFNWSSNMLPADARPTGGVAR